MAPGQALSDDEYLSSIGFADMCSEIRACLLAKRPAALEARRLAAQNLLTGGRVGTPGQEPDIPPAYPVSDDRSCDEFKIRHLERTDYHKGFCELLGQLTTVGSVSEEDFVEQFDQVALSNATHNVLVAVDKGGRIVATGSVLVERKFIHSCGKVGHIEDVVVLKTMRGKKLGQRIIEALQEVATHAGCYKIILDCARSNMPFYERQEFYEKEVQMRYDCHSPRHFRETSNFLHMSPPAQAVEEAPPVPL